MPSLDTHAYVHGKLSFAATVYRGEWGSARELTITLVAKSGEIGQPLQISGLSVAEVTQLLEVLSDARLELLARSGRD